ncbi:MAG: UDP-N-acetylmuramoyl-L-alanyl-D-glutamate--2,6-diaminopimelate ligase [Gemmatimonadetes bacterium]|nr:UDP-N-acetylmuramoyl-L-alanyl-D-glutamate--2,6-diaminopimelate ligase [Gemmatimonadota bacterium]
MPVNDASSNAAHTTSRPIAPLERTTALRVKALIQLSRLLDALPRKEVIRPPGQADRADLADQAGQEIGGIVHDSRSVKPGDVFVALCEPSGRDGHKYVRDAVARGASVVVQENEERLDDATAVIVPDTSRAYGLMAAAYYGRPADDLCLVGVTGTNGKTTVSLLVEAILRECGRSVGGIGTLGSRYMDEMLEWKLSHTTPYPMELHRTLRKIRDRGGECVVMEVSSHSLAWQRLSGLRFTTGVFTNLSREHLDDHKTFDAYREAKTLLFSELLDEKGSAVLNMDDPAFVHFRNASRARVLSYGLDKRADVHRAGPIGYHADRTTLAVQVRSDPPFNVTLPLLGRFNAYNALAAISVGLEFGIDGALMNRAVSGIRVPGRLERVDAGQPFNVLVDFAHTPDALGAVLSACREWTRGNLTVVFGCGGDRDPGKRPLMGRAASTHADVVIVTTDNPRTEPPDRIIRDIEPGLLPNVRSHIVQDRGEAIRKALREAGEGDTVLIAGRGDTVYQVVGDTQLEFGDRIKALECI